MDIITLCGDYEKHYEMFMKVYEILTAQENIVLMPGGFSYAKTEDEKIRLYILHRKKISISDYIFIITPDGTIDEKTKTDIDYAKSIGIKVIFMKK